MTLTNGHNGDRIKHRRHLVSRFRLRGGTMAEIKVLLAEAGITNPETGRPYSHGTINNDLKVLRAQWMASALADTDELTGRELAELREARRAVWRDSDHSEVRQNLALEIKLLGTAAPTKSEIAGADGGPAIVIIAQGGIDVDKDI